MRKMAEFGCMTTDCWLSNTTMSYISLTFHYVDPLFHLTSRVLDLDYIDFEHSAVNLHSRLSSLLEKWNIKHKVISYNYITLI